MRHGNYKGPLVRFKSKFTKGAPDECWLWQGAKDKNGYGLMWRGTDFDDKGATNLPAHRLSWLFHKGKIPDGRHVLHRCDVPACVNPDHLFLGDQIANNADMIAKGRHAHGSRHYKATLDEDAARAIKYGREAIKDAAAMHGVSYEIARRIRNGTRWKHL